MLTAMNPCPCGYSTILSGPVGVHLSKSRALVALSGPLRDRLDSTYAFKRAPRDPQEAEPGEPSSSTRLRHCRPRPPAFARDGCSTRACTDAYSKDAADAEARALMSKALARFALSARGYDRVLRVSRTIADLAGDDDWRRTSQRRCNIGSRRG